MFENYRVVAVTPAGRRQYLEILLPYILSEDIVDEYQLWLNTENESDLAYMHTVAKYHPRVKLISQPGVVARGAHKGPSINRFFNGCTDPNAIYIRFDDDIVFLDNFCIKTMIRRRVQNRLPFLIFPLIINNPVCSVLLTSEGKLAELHRDYPETYGSSFDFKERFWADGNFAEKLHRFFIELLADGRQDMLKGSPIVTSLSRLSINCFCWFGSDLAEAGGVPLFFDEEEYLSIIAPTKLRRPNEIEMRAVVAHYAFFSQRDKLDFTDILDHYRKLAEDKFVEFYLRYPSMKYERVPSKAARRFHVGEDGRHATFFVEEIGRQPRQIKFNMDGSLTGSHANESFWRVIDDCIEILHADNVTVTCRLRALPSRLDNQPEVYKGEFLGSLESSPEFVGREHIFVIP